MRDLSSFPLTDVNLLQTRERRPLFLCSPTSCNGCDFSPHELGLRLAHCYADGSVCVSTHGGADDRWSTSSFGDAPLGTNAVRFAPFGGGGRCRLATAGCDGKVRVWEETGEGSWVCDQVRLGMDDRRR